MASLYNGKLPPSSAANQQPDKQRLARRVIKDLAAFAGIAAAQLAATPRKAPRRQNNRLLYRKNLSDQDLDALVAKIGVVRWWAAFERVTKPRCDVTPDMFAAATTNAPMGAAVTADTSVIAAE
jgi:hypothetical protein